MKDYYDQEVHGPMSEIPLDRKYCQLAGGYVLCPALVKTEEGFNCRIYPDTLGKGAKNSLTGLMGSKLPVNIPFRPEDCTDGGTYVSLNIGRRGQIDPEDS